MYIKFDKFNRKRIPNIILCSPNGDEMYSLSDLKNRELVLRYNAISEFSFTALSKRDDGTPTDYFDFIKATRLIKVDNVGVFSICEVSETIYSGYKQKDVVCKSLEYNLSNRGISLAQGTYKFYDPISTDKTSILKEIMEYLPDWKLGEIDSDLWNVYRTFEIIDKNIYDFMINDIEEAYECIFIFDSINKTISAKTLSNAVFKTDVFFSGQNIIRELNITENEEELKTALNVYGADDLSIRTVNPMGSTTLYDFSYYKNKDWMSQGLIDALNAWEAKLKTSQTQYTDTLSQLKILNESLLNLNVQLTELEGQLKSLENLKSVRAEQGLSLTDINKQISDKEAEIRVKEAEIGAKEVEIASIKETQATISNSLSFKTSFTQEQYKELVTFIKTGTYQNTSFVVTDSMKETQRQSVIEELYNMGKEVLKRVAQPKYTFSIDALNFMNLIEYADITKQIQLGSEITIALNKSTFAYPVLLEITIDLDDVSNITLGFGNRLRMDKADYTLAELLKQTSNVVGDVNFNKGKWSESINTKDRFNEYLNSSLDASIREIISSNNMEVVIDSTGIHCKRLNPNTETYDPEQLWITGKSLLFTDDNFEHAKLALGKVTLPDGTMGYGLNSEIILGKIIAGGQLHIENSNQTFKVDGNGVEIINGKLIIRDESGSDTDYKDFIMNDVNSNLESALKEIGEDIKAVEDGVVDIFYEATPPTSAKHGDLWFDTSASGGNKVSKYNSLTSKWDELQDKSIQQALDDARNAKSTADRKITTYYQSSRPTGTASAPLDEGDLWFDTSTDGGNHIYRYDKQNERWVSVKDKSIDDLSQELADTITHVNNRFDNIDQTIADGVIHTFYQPSEPVGSEGDLWFDTANGKLYRHNGATTKPWQIIEDAKITDAIEQAQSAQATADGKISTYYLPNAPVGTIENPLGDGDLWFDISPEGGNKLYRYDKDRGKWVSVQDKAISFMSQELGDAITNINNKFESLDATIADGMIETFYQPNEPTGKIGDLWFDTANGKLYRHNGATTKPWQLVEDSKITEAIEQAQSAQATADGKITTYYLPTEPIGEPNKPLGEGDLWFDISPEGGNKLHRYDAERKKWVSVQDKSISGISQELGDAITNINNRFESLDATIADGMIETFYQPNEPSGKLGDLWFDTANGKLYRHNGASVNPWKLVEDAKITEAIEQAQSAQSTADGKITTYYLPTEPIGEPNKPLGEGDLWFDISPEGGNKLYRYDSERKKWVSVQDKAISGVSQDLADAIVNINNRFDSVDQTIADGMIETFYQPNEPTGKIGDLWFDTANGKLYRHNGATTKPWQLVEDSKITQAIEQAQSAQTTADGKITTYYLPTEPIGTTEKPLGEGDLWFDISPEGGNKLYRYDLDRGKWVSVQDKGIDKVAQDLAESLNVINNKFDDVNQTITDGMIETFYQPNEPSGKLGDLWFDTANGKLYRHNGATTSPWQLVEDAKITDAIEQAQSAQSTADGKITAYYLPNAPVGTTEKPLDEGDLWFDISSSGKNKLYRYDKETGKWISVQDGAIWDVNDKIDNVLSPDGNVNTEKLTGHINATINNMLSANNKLVLDGEGIKCMDNVNYNLANKVVFINSEGILFAKERVDGVLNWKTAIDATGITADAITTGTLRGRNIELLGTRNQVFINPTEGLTIQKKVGSSWENTFSLDSTTGDAVFKGKISGGEININNNFTVSSAGNVVANNIKITGGTLNLNNLTMTGTISWEQLPNDVLDTGSFNWGNLQGRPDYLTSTKITRTSIESPNIIGGSIVGATITQDSSNKDFCHSQLIGGRLQFYKDSVTNNIGTLCGDATDEKMWLEGTNALKLTAYKGDISLQPQGQHGDLNTQGTIWLYGKVVVRGGVVVDENNNPLVGGKAVFG